ncbi:hypothetical protein Glove_476g60 [Diversispora epigaea]|uniref:Uncharacterized protein n=1 Tax=Diversispora epigaea TaxID=1348612 RepID=A0A397GMW7_9GLOM|nr:hypothetical protein Glove_476g60 [Diversispora epigaea]
MNKPRSSTTSFLTATTLIYAIGAGIIAAVSTRLALQLFLIKRLNCTYFNYKTQMSPLCDSKSYHDSPRKNPCGLLAFYLINTSLHVLALELPWLSKL